MLRRCVRALFAGVVTVVLAAPVAGQSLDSATIAGMKWRTVGPANFGGRVSDVEGIPGPSKTLFIATAGGGIWKTTNNGQTWRPLFDDKRVIGMGMLAIAPSDTNEIWAGTGEPNSRNTILPGAGVYKSMDGGLTWTFMGLKQTQFIGRIVVDPRDPKVVWVAALGAAWNPSPDRGLYKTTDGGSTWKLVKFVSNKAGFVDVALDPRNPDVVYAASWERFRTPYSLGSGGPGSGLWKSTDGGATWSEIRATASPRESRAGSALRWRRRIPTYIYARGGGGGGAEGWGVHPGAGPGGQRTVPFGRRRQELVKMNSSTSGRSTTRRFASTPATPTGSISPRPRSSSPTTAARRRGRPRCRCTSTTTPCGSIRPIRPGWVIGDDGGIDISFDAGGNFRQLQNLPIASSTR